MHYTALFYYTFTIHIHNMTFLLFCCFIRKNPPEHILDNLRIDLDLLAKLEQLLKLVLDAVPLIVICGENFHYQGIRFFCILHIYGYKHLPQDRLEKNIYLKSGLFEELTNVLYSCSFFMLSLYLCFLSKAPKLNSLISTSSTFSMVLNTSLSQDWIISTSDDIFTLFLSVLLGSKQSNVLAFYHLNIIISKQCDLLVCEGRLPTICGLGILRLI